MIIDACGRQVDHHHAGFGIALEMGGIFEARGADARRQTEFGVIGQSQRFLVIGDPLHGSDGPENFLAGHAHRLSDMGEQSRLQIEAGIVAFQHLAAPMQGCAFITADLKIFQILIQLALVDHRSDMGACFQGVVNDQTFETLGHGIDEGIMDACCDDEARGGGATLSGREKRAIDGGFHGGFQVGIIEHDQRVFAAHFQLHFFHRRDLDASRRHFAAGRDRTGKGDGGDILVLQQGLTDFRAATHHQIEHTGRQAGADQNIHQCPSRTGDKICGFEHDRVAIGQSGRDLPCRNGNREIPRGDHTDHAQRIAGDLDADTRTHARHGLAGQAQTFTGKKRKNLACTAGFADAFGQGLAFFACQQAAQLVLAGENFIGCLFQNLVAFLRSGARPGRECRLGGGNGFVGLCARCAGIMSDHIRGVGRVDVLVDAGAVDPLAADMVFELS